MTPLRTAALVVLLAACGQETFDPAPLGSIVGYTSWKMVGPLSGPVPGHGDTVRPIYVNDVAASYSHAGRYHPGSILVKEIHEGSEDGPLDYISVMRKLSPEGPDASVPVEGGWVFSYLTGEPGGEETYWDLCWAQCHRQAPWDGAWFDYGD